MLNQTSITHSNIDLTSFED